METKEPTNDPEIMVGPILLLMRRMERYELLLDQLVERGVVLPKELARADLLSSLSHAERLIKVRGKIGKDTQDVEEAAEVVRNELSKIA